MDRPVRLDRLTLAGLAVVAAAAAWTSFGALSGLAAMAGWSGDVRFALPVIVDTLAAVCTRAWLGTTTASHARRFARQAALVSVAVSMMGNTLYHLIVSGWLHPSVALVVGVAMVPPVGLATAAHLVAVLRPDSDPLPTAEEAAVVEAVAEVRTPVSVPVAPVAAAPPATVTSPSVPAGLKPLTAAQKLKLDLIEQFIALHGESALRRHGGVKQLAMFVNDHLRARGGREISYPQVSKALSLFDQHRVTAP